MPYPVVGPFTQNRHDQFITEKASNLVVLRLRGAPPELTYTILAAKFPENDYELGAQGTLALGRYAIDYRLYNEIGDTNPVSVLGVKKEDQDLNPNQEFALNMLSVFSNKSHTVNFAKAEVNVDRTQDPPRLLYPDITNLPQTKQTLLNQIFTKSEEMFAQAQLSQTPDPAAAQAPSHAIGYFGDTGRY